MISKTMFKSFLVNLSLTLIKLLGSFLSNSKTLLADSVHCLSDMLTDVVGLVGVKLSSKKPDEEHPFGHGKIEYLTSIVMSIFIIFLGLTIIKNAFTETHKTSNFYAIIIMIITIIIKYILSSYLIKKGKSLNSNILITNGMESRYDSYSSSLALIFIILSIIGKENTILKYSDILGSIVMSIFTLKIGVEILLKNISSVLGEIDDDPIKEKEIKEVLSNYKEINKIRRITILKYGAYSSLTIDVIMDGSITLNELYMVEKKIKSNIKKSNLNIRYVTLNAKPKKKSR